MLTQPIHRLLDWIQSEHAAYFAQVLGHSLWQAPLITGLVWLVLRGLPAKNAMLRYTLSLTALPLVLICMATTWSLLSPSVLTSSTTPSLNAPYTFADLTPPPAIDSPKAGHTDHNTDAAHNTPGSHPTTTQASGTQTTRASLSIQWQPWLLATWCIGAITGLCRTLLSYGLGRQQLLAGTKPVDPAILQTAQRIARQLKLHRTIQVFEQAACLSPCVLGVLKPIILLPPAALTGLSTDQLEAILAHELAHAKRLDAVVDFLQRVLSSLLFFNPAIWWLNQLIRQEREACCDRIAAQAVKSDTLVAEALHATAQSMGTRLQQAALFQPALTATGGNLRDRITRLLNPKHSPRTLLSWPVLVTVLILSGVGLLAIERGTDATVAFADKILNPETYVQETTALTQSLTLHEPKRTADGDIAPESMVTVSGMIRSADGSPLSKRLSLTIFCKHHNGNAATGWGTDDGPTPDVRIFSCDRIRPGIVSLTVQTEGFAPSFSQQVAIGPGQKLNNLELVLERGFEMQAEVVDENGSPIAGATIKTSLRFSNRQSRPSGQQGGVVTDASGHMPLTHLAPTKVMTAVVTAPGYERLTTSPVKPEPNGLLRAVLSKAIPIEGVILDANTRRSIAGAEIHLIYRRNDSSRDPRADYYRNPPLAVTDEHGRFTTDAITRIDNASLWINAPGMQPRVLYGINADREPLKITLEPAIKLTVHLKGDPKLLKTDRQGQPQIKLSQSLDIQPDHSHGRSFKASVQIDENGRMTAVFDQHLLAHEASLHVANKNIQLEDLATTAKQGPLVIDFMPSPESPEASDAPFRQVVIQLVPPDGWPAPQGYLETPYFAKPDATYQHTAKVPVIDGRAEFKAYFNPRPGRPTLIDPSGIDAPGYWLPKPGYGETFQLVPGEGPATFSLKVYPAGVIYGTVVDENRAIIPDADISMQKVDEPHDLFNDRRTDANWWNNIDVDHEGRFVITPVPFGGTYQPTASSSPISRYAIGWSKPIKLDAKNPRQETVIVIPRGQDYRVNVLDPNGTPIPNAELELHRSTDNGGYGWSPNETTDTRGQFTFQALHFDGPGIGYRVDIHPTKGYTGQPIELKRDQFDYTVHLKPGLTLSGQLINNTTGDPISGKRITAQYPYGQQGGYAGQTTATTGVDGRFTLEGLEATTYIIRAEDLFAKGSVVNRNADGSAKSVTTADWPKVKINQDTQPLKLHAISNPWR